MKNEFMYLCGTPFVACKRGDLKLSPYAIGRRDTREMLCLGSFNKDLADMFNDGETAFLRIKPDGSATQEMKLTDCNVEQVRFDGDDAIVMIKFGCYWVFPYGFEEWVTKIENFKNFANELQTQSNA